MNAGEIDQFEATSYGERLPAKFSQLRDWEAVFVRYGSDFDNIGEESAVPLSREPVTGHAQAAIANGDHGFSGARSGWTHDADIAVGVPVPQQNRMEAAGKADAKIGTPSSIPGFWKSNLVATEQVTPRRAYVPVTPRGVINREQESVRVIKENGGIRVAVVGLHWQAGLVQLRCTIKDMAHGLSLKVTSVFVNGKRIAGYGGAEPPASVGQSLNREY